MYETGLTHLFYGVSHFFWHSHQYCFV